MAVGDIASATSTAPDPNNPPVYNTRGGDRGGYISTTDTQNIVAFLAPSQFTGDDSGYYGGSLSFSLQDTVPSDPQNYPAVIIYSGGQAISYSGPPPGTTWTAYSIPLTEAGWTIYPGGEQNGTTPLTKAQFKAILANVTALAIEADWHTGADNTGLDSVSLAGRVKTPVAAPVEALHNRFAAAAAG
ncbi:MAG: hypothetical protein H0X27_01100, partial [Caulobacteraceae bacterium]|nr:hypothetical protein [Caulobacteraceae bacterium]